MALYRNVYTSFWNDSFMVDRTSDEKLFYLYLITNPKTTICGIYEFSTSIASVETGLSKTKIEALLVKFENEYRRVVRSKTTSEIIITNWLKHNNNPSPQVQTAIRNAFSAVKDRALIQYAYGIDLKVYGIDMVSRACLSSPVTDSVSIQKGKYGKYQHVLLTDDEYTALASEYPNRAELIGFLDGYMEEKPSYSSESHYLAIKRWVCNAVQERKQKVFKTGGKPDTKIDWLDKYMADNFPEEAPRNDDPRNA